MRRSEHLSNDEMVRYAERRMPPHDLLATDDHLADCDECRARLDDMLPVGDSGALEAFLQLDAGPHLAYPQLEAYVDHTMKPSELMIMDEHLQTCNICARQVEDLRTLADRVRSAPRSEIRVDTTRRVPFWKLLIPAFALLAVIVAAGMWLLRERERADQIVQLAPTPAAVASPEAINEEPIAIADNDAQHIKPSASLADGSGRIEVDAIGKVSGLNEPEFERAAAKALTSAEITIAGDERQLRASSGTLMGGEHEGVPFALAAPVGTVVESQQPTLRWKPLAGAETYRVTVFDEKFTQVASSPDLSATSWRSAPLKRGGVYRWQVTALRNGEEIRSPVRPSSDARFKVVDADAARKLSIARRHANSHLIMGLAYAEAGLLSDAEREFRALVQKNPDSAVAKKLLDKVKRAR